MICAPFYCFFCVLIGFDSLHNTDSMRKVIFQVNRCMMKLNFVNFQVGKKNQHGTDIRDLDDEKYKRATYWDLHCLSMWIFAMNMEGLARGNLCSSFHLYSYQFPLELFLSCCVFGLRPNSGSRHISLMPWGSRVQQAECCVTRGHMSVSH